MLHLILSICQYQLLESIVIIIWVLDFFATKHIDTISIEEWAVVGAGAVELLLDLRPSVRGPVVPNAALEEATLRVASSEDDLLTIHWADTWIASFDSDIREFLTLHTEISIIPLN